MVMIYILCIRCRYLIEIASIYNIEYEPDPQVMKDENRPVGPDGQLIDFQDNRNNLGGDGGGAGGSGGAIQPIGFIGFPQPPSLPVMPALPHPGGAFNYPSAGPHPKSIEAGGSSYQPSAPFNYNIPPHPQNQPEAKDLNVNAHFLSVRAPLHSSYVCDCD